VGRSTLPCIKLRAVVDAAKEISQLESEERSVFPDSTFFDGVVVTEVKALGADDFLPIFIFAFVRSKIERPYAVCTLRTIYLLSYHRFAQLIAIATFSLSSDS
jgi:hypothetical protein